MSTSSACLSYQFQPNRETFKGFASPIYLLIRYLMQTKTSVQELLANIHNSSLNGDAVGISKAAFKTSLNLLSTTTFLVDLADPNSATGRELSKLVHSILEVGSQSTREIDKTQIERLFVDLFLAGNDTTSVTLEWVMAELLYNLEVLSKAKAKLKQIIGKGNAVVESDIDCLPYLQAIVKETFRLHPPVLLLLLYKVGADVEIQGFTVPKGACKYMGYRQGHQFIGKPKLI
ncbi:geraniol 8-hydroxylase [Quercus suber]|uniref:Geraniol 8-hydroxylase n=1 Tax=Quercus suber TaxID=58331 RepID=A0AAW0JQH3_QUESU